MCLKVSFSGKMQVQNSGRAALAEQMSFLGLVVHVLLTDHEEKHPDEKQTWVLKRVFDILHTRHDNIRLLTAWVSLQIPLYLH